MKKLTFTLTILTLLFAAGQCGPDKGKTSFNPVLVLGLIPQPQSQPKAKIRWQNNSARTIVNGGLYTAAGCTGTPVSGSTIANVATTTTTGYSSVQAGTYYIYTDDGTMPPATYFCNATTTTINAGTTYTISVGNFGVYTVASP